jgi:hypothetical protein
MQGERISIWLIELIVMEVNAPIAKKIKEKKVSFKFKV